MKFGKAVVKSRVVILIVALVLLIPSVIIICRRISKRFAVRKPCSKIFTRARFHF